MGWKVPVLYSANSLDNRPLSSQNHLISIAQVGWKVLLGITKTLLFCVSLRNSKSFRSSFGSSWNGDQLCMSYNFTIPCPFSKGWKDSLLYQGADDWRYQQRGKDKPTVLYCMLGKTAFEEKLLLPPSSQGYGFSSGHVWMWELDYKESWALKNWCFWTVVLEKTLESPLDCREIKPVYPKGDQSWIFIGRTDAEAETL